MELNITIRWDSGILQLSNAHRQICAAHRIAQLKWNSIFTKIVYFVSFPMLMVSMHALNAVAHKPHINTHENRSCSSEISPRIRKWNELISIFDFLIPSDQNQTVCNAHIYQAYTAHSHDSSLHTCNNMQSFYVRLCESELTLRISQLYKKQTKHSGHNNGCTIE